MFWMLKPFQIWYTVEHAQVAPNPPNRDPQPDKSLWRHQIETFSALLAFVQGIHRYPMNSSHKGQWRSALIFFISVWMNSWINNREAGDLGRYRAHYDVIVMFRGVFFWVQCLIDVMCCTQHCNSSIDRRSNDPLCILPYNRPCLLSGQLAIFIYHRDRDGYCFSGKEVRKTKYQNAIDIDSSVTSSTMQLNSGSFLSAIISLRADCLRTFY